jgi:hypothetical protein
MTSKPNHLPPEVFIAFLLLLCMAAVGAMDFFHN